MLLMESGFLVNLILLVSGILYADSEKQKVVLINISIAMAFMKFCAIIPWNILLSMSFLDAEGNKLILKLRLTR